MKTHRALFVARAPLLLAAVVASLVSGSAANAQTSVTASTTSATSTSSASTTTKTSALVAVKGVVSGQPESVSFSGQAQLNASVVTDPDFGAAPTVLLTIDLSNVTGVGSLTGKEYVISNQDVMNRRLAVADTVQIHFPFYLNGASPTSASVGMASFDLSFNTSTLKLTGASGSIASP